MPAEPTTSWWYTFFVLAWLAMGCVSAAHAIMFKRDPRSSTIWLLVSFLLPIAGPWLYWVVGINRLERRAAAQFGNRERRFAHEQITLWANHDPQRDPAAHLGALRRVADRVTRLPLLSGNRLTPLHNGEQAYPQMLKAIAGAERTVTLASYIFDCDDVGRQFVDALHEAAGRGVQVHVLVDGIGALGHFSRMGRLLLKSGVEVEAFFPLRFPLGRLRLNLRNHRKLLVVDGTTGFTGGMNISARHLLEQPSPHRVEDLHFELAGPIVSEMQHIFVEDWAFITGRVLDGQGYFPATVNAAGDAWCRGISSGPDENLGIVYWMLLAAFSAARESVHVVTPYFIPTPSLISAMCLAAMRGVRVTLMLPYVTDMPFVRWATQAYLWQLLEHGVHVIWRQSHFVHTKLLIVDRRWILLGSANLDPRSFRLNFEFNVECYDAELAAGLSDWLDSLLPESREITLQEIDGRSLPRRLRDGTFKLFSPYL